MTNSPLGRGDLIRSGPAFFLIDHIRPEGATLGYRLVRQTQLRTRNEYLLPSTTTRLLGLPPRAAWLVRVHLTRIPTEANREHVSCASDELLDEIARQRVRIAAAAAAEAAATPRIVAAVAATALALSSCNAVPTEASTQVFRHARRVACPANCADIAQALAMPGGIQDRWLSAGPYRKVDPSAHGTGPIFR